MKRYMRGLVALIVILGFSGGSVSAVQESCSSGQITISNTGPDSTNIVTCVTVSDVKVTCNNSVYVLTDSSQKAISGAAAAQNNNGSGGAVSGNATNENGTNVQIGASCGVPASTVVPETPVTPAETPTTGIGAAGPTPVRVAALPNTANTSVTELAVTGLIALVSILGLSQLGLSLYRRAALK